MGMGQSRFAADPYDPPAREFVSIPITSGVTTRRRRPDQNRDSRDAVTQVQRLHSIVERMAQSQPWSSRSAQYRQQLHRAATPLVGLLKPQFGIDLRPWSPTSCSSRPRWHRSDRRSASLREAWPRSGLSSRSASACRRAARHRSAKKSAEALEPDQLRQIH